MQYVKESIITKLLSDSNLMIRIGNNPPATGGVYESYSFNLDTSSYPRIHVDTVGETPITLEQVDQASGKRPAKVFFTIDIFSKSSTSSELENIEARVREVLDGGTLSNPNLRFFTCEFESFLRQDRDPETGIWHNSTRYTLGACPV